MSEAEDEQEYHKRRALEELEQAERSSDPEAAASHQQLAQLHLDRFFELQGERFFELQRENVLKKT